MNGPPTAGMTTKVVKGSLWTLAGQVAPLLVSLVTTPFVIRLLGAEGYGVFILVGLIPTYLGFADFGMGMASTKFASEAYAAGDPEKEARIVRTAALLALCTSVPVAALLIAFAAPIVTLFNVPEAFLPDAALALRIAAVTFVINFLNGIFNTPQLARLRMDLNTMVNAGSRIAGLIAAPIVLYLGYGVVGAVVCLFATSVMTLMFNLLVSQRLSGKLSGFSISTEAVKAILRFGVGLAVSGVAAIVLVNAEKGILSGMISVEALAFYSVAFTFASMATMFSTAMIQSLIPAFSQLTAPERRTHLESLFHRSVKLILIMTPPGAAFLAIVAPDFFHLFAGEQFRRESTFPFYILLAGLVFNLPGFIPYSVIVSHGRTDIFAKLYWIELLPYLVLTLAMTAYLGIIGAALAWASRVAFDGVVFFILARRVTGARLEAFDGKNYLIPLAAVLFLPGIFAGVAVGVFLPIALAIYALGTLGYGLLVWKMVADPSEQQWVSDHLRLRFNQ